MIDIGTFIGDRQYILYYMLVLRVLIILLLLYLLYTAVTAQLHNGFRRPMPCRSWSFAQLPSCLLPCLCSHTFLSLESSNATYGMRATACYA